MKHLLCFGAGYSARAAAVRAIADGWSVVGTSRSHEGCERLRALGLEALVFDGETLSEPLARAIDAATHVLVSVAPDPEAAPERCDPVLNVFADQLRRADHLKWIGYLSTVGVYGNHDGAWVDESTTPVPVSRRSVARVAAENNWMALHATAAWQLQIHRLSGIYGPGRNPIARLRAGKSRRIIKPGQVFNRIHVDDIASAVMAGLAGRGQHVIYNVTDNEPAPPQDVIAYAANLIGYPVPPDLPFATADLTPMARSFYGENKRVKNLRLHNDLGVDLRFPTYREGLAALAQS